MSLQDLYDFESVIPTAAASVLRDAGLTVSTIVDTRDFQTIRPRVDVIYRHQGEESPRRISNLPNGERRSAAFRGELRIHAITDADAPGKLVHAQYRAVVRNILATLPDQINEVQLPFHKIQWLESGNEETGVRTQDGYQQTTFPFAVKLSIQQNAWAQLE